jgi:hypothetical protein
VEVLVRIVLGVLLVAHGLVHLLWFAPNDDPSWPFRLDRSWLLPDTTRKPVGVVLVALVVVAFALLGLAVWGVPGLASIWPPGTAATRCGAWRPTRTSTSSPMSAVPAASS